LSFFPLSSASTSFECAQLSNPTEKILNLMEILDADHHQLNYSEPSQLSTIFEPVTKMSQSHRTAGLCHHPKKMAQTSIERPAAGLAAQNGRRTMPPALAGPTGGCTRSTPSRAKH
jgi:hypothetical protein